METNKFDSSIRNVVEESRSFYGEEAERARERIWNKIQAGSVKDRRLVIIPYLAAASVILLLFLGGLSYSLIHTRNRLEAIAAENIQLKERDESLRKSLMAETVSSTPLSLTDTVYIEKKVIVPQDVVREVRITDTVYVSEIVYIEKETVTDENLLTVNTADETIPFPGKDQVYLKREFLIEKDDPPANEKKIRLRIGGNRNTEAYGILALTGKLGK